MRNQMVNKFGWAETSFEAIGRSYSNLSKGKPLSYLTLLNEAYSTACYIFIVNYDGHIAKMTKELVKSVPLFFLIDPINPVLRSPFTDREFRGEIDAVNLILNLCAHSENGIVCYKRGLNDYCKESGRIYDKVMDQIMVHKQRKQILTFID